jgi:hypothetical protein
MSDDITTAEVKQEITPDFILNLYDEMKKMTDPDEKRAQRAVIEVLSEHLGEWLVLDE